MRNLMTIRAQMKKILFSVLTAAIGVVFSVNADVTLVSEDPSSPWTQDANGVWSSPALTNSEDSVASITVTGPCIVKAKYRLVLEGATSSDKYSAEFYLGGAYVNLADGWREISSIIWDEGETDVSVSVYNYSDGTLTAYLKDIVVESATIGSEVIDGLEWSYAASSSEAIVTSVYTEDDGEPAGDVTVPATLGGQPVTEIAGGVLCWCGDLTSLTFPDSVKKIGDRVGGACEALESVTFGAGFESMAEYAFVRCHALQSFTVSAANQNFSSHDGALYSKDGTKLILCPAGKKSLVTASGTTEIAENACMDSESLVSLVIGGGVATVGDRAFYNCYQLRDLSLPDSLESIGEEAFNNTAVTSLTLPSGLKSIGANAFAWCGGLTTLVVPTGIESIGEGAFVECGSLSAVYLPKKLEGVLDVASVFGSSFDSSLITWYETLTYYTVTLDANYAGGTQTQLQVLKFIDELPVPATRTGYAFSGWWTDPTDEDVAEQLVAGAEITGNATYYAHWVTESRFTFGGDVAWFAAESEDGAATTIQSGPLGYGQTSTASMSVTGTGRIMVYYANNSYTDRLCVYVDGAKLASFGYADGNYGYVDVFTQGAHTITFSYENESGDPESFAQIYEVEWTPQDSYTVTLNANGGTVSPAALMVLGTLPELPMPRKNGGVFVGWYTAAEGGERAVAGDEVTADTTLYARWADVPFTVGGDRCWMLDADGSYVSESLEIGEEIYAEVRFTGPCRVSFDWKADASYWSNNAFEFYVDGVRTNALQATSGGTPYWDAFSLDIEGDGEHVFRWLFANDDPWGTGYSNSNRVWLKNVVVGSVSTITFNENYEGGSVVDELCAGKLGTLPVPKRDDYFMFTGWWTQCEGGTQVTSETPVTGEATYYAHWAPTPYKFDGEWFEDVDGSWRPMATDTWTNYSATKDVEGPCTVSFKWKAVIFNGYHTVDIYDIVNGGYTTLVNTNASTEGWVEQTLTIADGSVHTIKAEFYSGYYASSNYYIALKDFVVTPIASYTVTFQPNCAGDATTRKVIQDAAIGELPVLKRDGYVMNGWWTAATGGERISAATEIHANSTYYAHWVECPFTFSGVRPWEMGPDGELRTAPMTVYGDYNATATVQGPCVVTFEWKSSVGSSGRYMRLDVDGSYNDRCESGDWVQKTVKFPGEGEHTVLFNAYVNNAGSATAGENCFMMRNYNVAELVPCVVTFNANYAGGENTTSNYVAGDALGELPSVSRPGYGVLGWFTAATGGDQVTPETVVSGNATYYAHWVKLPFETGGDANWFVNANGEWQPGDINDSQRTWAKVTVTGPCTASFKWKVSSESGYDKLHFYVDSDSSDYISAISGNVNWSDAIEVSFEDSNTHVLKWEYTKDSSVSGGDDCGYVKDFTVVSAGTPETPIVNIDATKMEAPVEDANGNIVIAAKDGKTLTQADADALEIMSPTEPGVDITAAYVKTLDAEANAIVIRLVDPEIDPEGGASYAPATEDPTGLLDNAEAVETAGALAAKPETTGDQKVGALPVKMYPGLWYQASWGSSLDSSMTPGVKFRAESGQTHIGVIKQTGTSGFYKVTVSEQ